MNKYQSTVEQLGVDQVQSEIQEQFYDFVNNVPFIRSLISEKRQYAKDLPRDDEGKIIVNLEQPHILEDMDYFRPSAIHFQKYGVYTKLRPNANPQSEFGKWLAEEVRRCRYGYVRKKDGEWISGDYYFFLNYWPILQVKKDKSGKSVRVVDFPRVWDGHYLLSHYLYQARQQGKHSAELASRAKGKSYWGSSMLGKRFLLGESDEVKESVQCVVTASERKYIQGANQILDMFQKNIDFLANNTEFPRKRLQQTLQGLQWTSGYMDMDTGTRRGSGNSVIGITSKDDESKLRGSRGVLYLIEEAGTFPRLLGLYNVLRPSVEQDGSVYGLIHVYGTAGDQDSDFSSMQELMYNPLGYNLLALKNVFDKEGQGRPKFTFFFPGYLNREGCYDEDGNSDVTKAIFEILKDRYQVKYNSSDINTITRRIAEIPITPQEAILRNRGNIFPITAINERLNQLDNDPKSFDDIYVGELALDNDGEVKFKPTNDIPIRDFPLKSQDGHVTNRVEGAIEIYAMPEKDKDGKVPWGRYIASLDPVDNDESQSTSLSSTFVLDLLTDKIVAEYTGRANIADVNYEKTRLLCLFYNAQCLYESNIKGFYSYMSRMSSTFLLADTPSYLRDKQIIKTFNVGNASKGVVASQMINNHEDELIKNWLIKPVPIIRKAPDGTEVEETVMNLYFLKNRALLKELSLYNPDINVDRVRSLGVLMILREAKYVQSAGQINNLSEQTMKDYLGNDPFFTQNYDEKPSIWIDY